MTLPKSTLLARLKVQLNPDYKPENVSKVVVRLNTSGWVDNREAIHFKRSLSVLKRKSRHYDWFLEDLCESEYSIDRIINLSDCKDGIYEVITVNEHRDWESGYIEEYDFELVPYVEEETDD